MTALPMSGPRVLAYTDALGRGGAEISLGHLVALSPLVVGVAGVSDEVVGWVAGRRAEVRAHVLRPYDLPGHVRLLRRLRPDVLHVNRCVPWACATGILAGLLTGTRVVTVDQLPLRTTRLPQLLRTRAFGLRVDAQVAVGAASARRIEDFYALGRGSVRSIPNGVPDLGPAPPAPGVGPLVVGSIGRLDRMKGHDVLLRAVAAVGGVRLVIVGDGSERSALTRLAAELGVELSLPGWVESPRSLLAEFDVFALPSRSEGFPLVLGEAMLAGRPVVASRVGAVAEAVGPAGLLVEPDDVAGLADSLRALRDDAGLRARLGADARSYAVGKHTAEVMAARYAELWRDVAARRRGGAAARLRVPAPRA